MFLRLWSMSYIYFSFLFVLLKSLSTQTKAVMDNFWETWRKILKPVPPPLRTLWWKMQPLAKTGDCDINNYLCNGLVTLADTNAIVAGKLVLQSSTPQIPAQEKTTIIVCLPDQTGLAYRMECHKTIRKGSRHTICKQNCFTMTKLFLRKVCTLWLYQICNKKTEVTKNIKKKPIQNRIYCRQGWILLRDLRDYLVDNLEKFRQSSPGTTV